jgi:hypothetical protein
MTELSDMPSLKLMDVDEGLFIGLMASVVEVVCEKTVRV